MSSILSYFLVAVVCYFIGAIPFAYIIVKLSAGVDIRTVGSGNAGATNAARVMGKKGFISVFICDFLKGFLPVFIVLHYSSNYHLAIVAALATVIGHSYTIFLKFKGGKGVATGGGVFFALAPFGAVCAVAAFVIVFALTRMVSAGSIVAAVSLFIAVLFTSDSLELKIFTFIICAFVIYKHKSNIVRIMNGTENRFIKKG